MDALLRSPYRQVCWLPVGSLVSARAFPAVPSRGLVSSVARYGLLNPIAVCLQKDGRYRVVSGEKRLQACIQLGYDHIDAILLPEVGEDTAFRSLLSTVQNEPLHFFETAEAYKTLMDTYQMTRQELARHLGCSVSIIGAKLRLLRLSPALRQVIFEENLSEHHARALLRLPDYKAQMRIAHRAAAMSLTAQQTEKLVAEALSRLPVPPPRTGNCILLMRDSRLYLNAVRGIVEQMQESGMNATLSTNEYGETLEIRIQMPKSKK